ncbi:UPF0450 protein C17orf58 homolog [Lampris incognitus]|uniref:UPF0450 protein C17orf58 homolog n=1 Tax=Lampris incognitus TaxID=2546036 RepID=UPI0024B51A66|nr:UPF0450 protein C17orf58 homolog [Lampris incognitus]
MCRYIAWPQSVTVSSSCREEYTLAERAQGSPADAAQSSQSRLGLKEPSLAINELLEKSSRTGDTKYSLHPLPSGVWPKHGDLIPLPRHHGAHTKGKKGSKSDRLAEHNSEKNRGETAGLLPKSPPPPPLPGAAAGATDRTPQKSNNPDSHVNVAPPQQGGDPEGHPNSRPRGQPHEPPAQGHQPPQSAARRDPPHRRLDPEENRPGKSALYQPGVGGASRNNSRPSSVLYNRRSSSLLYQLDVLKQESDFTHEAICMSECRKEKEEREYYCYSEFAVNGIVHDMDVVRKGVRLITLMVSSDGFYKMSRLYMSPDSFFFKVRLLVLDTYKCSKPCPDLKLGKRQHSKPFNLL